MVGKNARPHTSQSTQELSASTKITSLRHKQLTGNGTTRQKAQLVQSSHAWTNSARSPPLSSASSAKPTTLSAKPSNRWLLLVLNTCGAKWDKPAKTTPTASYFANWRAPWAWRPHEQTPACAYASSAPYSAAATTPNTTGRQEKKPASAKPSGTTISATALEVTRNTTTDSNTASKRCSIHPAWSLITPDYKYLQHHRRNQYNNIVNKSNNTHLHSIYYMYDTYRILIY